MMYPDAAFPFFWSDRTPAAAKRLWPITSRDFAKNFFAGGGQAKIFLALFPSWKPDSLARRLQRERIRTANPRPWPLLVPHPAFWLANGNVFVRELILSSRNFAEILAKFCQKFGNAKNSPNFCRNFRESLPKFWRKVFAEVLPKIWRNLCQIFAEV